MSIIKDKYKVIAPQIKYLCDEVVLAQAWKKSQLYIRKHNWYADILELDCSTVDLENNISLWIRELEDENYKSDAIKLVLAPKNKQWYFSDSKIKDMTQLWSSRKKDRLDLNDDRIDDKDEEIRLRPLTHLTIRDQTISTAAMLCLADAIETCQGPTEESNYFSAQKQQIYSYGNRLHCNWESNPQKNKKGIFSWGSSQSYRQYYQDYRSFLLRPKKICQGYASGLSPNKTLYVVSIDLKEFYDHIDVKALIGQLKKLYKEYFNNYILDIEYNNEDKFWDKLESVFSWEWEDSDIDSAKKLLGKDLPKGLPQGLVASGFLSNAYLINFDRMVGAKIDSAFTPKSFVLLDYCRYVDDIRLVIEASSDIDIEKISELVTKEVNKFLKEYQKSIGTDFNLKVNDSKTKVTPYRELIAQNNVSSLMNMFQGVISGTPDVDELRQVTGGLEGLLGLSEQILNEVKYTNNPLTLANISTPNIDIRDDTLKRFVATRMVRTLRLRRSMTDLSEVVNKGDDLENFTAGQLLNNEFESAARKLISAWSANPSLTLLLKCGLDLYPDPDLLIPVLEALKTKLYVQPQDKIIKKEMKVAEYVCADLLRAAATDIGYRLETYYPESADLKGFREELVVFARDLLINRPESPWYLIHQAILYLISSGDYGYSLESIEKNKVLKYALLQDIALYKTSINYSSDIITLSLVLQQIQPNTEKYVTWFIELMRNQDDADKRKEAIMIVSFSRPDIMSNIIKSRRLKNAKWIKEIPFELKTSLKPLENKEIIIKDGRRQSLIRIIQSSENPFKQENALLKLALSILVHSRGQEVLEKGVMASDILLKEVKWNEIQNPRKENFKVDFQITNDSIQKYREIPPWVKKGYEWLYSLGRILRSSITGEYDFTSNAFLKREANSSYKGLKSTWFTRRLGLSIYPRGLLNEPSPISPWLSEFLIKLLQWPGIKDWSDQINEFDKINHTGDLIKIIKDRLDFQNKIYGSLSKTPFYTLPLPPIKEKMNQKIQVAIVQPLLPKTTDFNVKDPLHWTPAFRAKHRNHIASLCNLVNNQLKASRSAESYESASNYLDLIVFPELTVHPDDIDLLRGLSDATKANIFTGLTFISSNDNKSIINQGLWLLRAERSTGREFIYVYQGKQHMTKFEKEMNINGHRPYQLIINMGNGQQNFNITGSICYDATDLTLAADLREVSDMYVIAAMNQDVQTFDNMVTALQYHMYQPVILANTGEFGGSTAQAPFTKHARQIAHTHGNNQVAVSIFEVDASSFKHGVNPIKVSPLKTPPAGYIGRKWF
ncbi:RNA-directed DNA polymerase [Mesobacillus jeotgali]|uniref:RNA-directed DNA polymerase n=1 Tax=Mesobacillus jeotgali TaxID=129985 RepID=UPI0009A81CC1|nr:RNA-directed DNA polymerase [Mesobacillus jeotgali]